MRRILLIAVREFIATVSNRAFVIGLFIFPAIIAIGAVAAPRLFNFRNFQVTGDVAVVDPTGVVAPELRSAFDPKQIASRRAEEARQALEQAPQAVRDIAASGGNNSSVPGAGRLPIPDVHMTELPANTDLQEQKAWLSTDAGPGARRHLALIVIHADAVVRAQGSSKYGTYDLYVPPNLDDRADSEIQQGLQQAIINARVRARSLDKETIEAIVSVPRVRSV